MTDRGATLSEAGTEGHDRRSWFGPCPGSRRQPGSDSVVGNAAGIVERHEVVPGPCGKRKRSDDSAPLDRARRTTVADVTCLRSAELLSNRSRGRTAKMRETVVLFHNLRLTRDCALVLE